MCAQSWVYVALIFYISSALIVAVYNSVAKNEYKEGDIRVFVKSSLSVIVFGNSVQ